MSTRAPRRPLRGPALRRAAQLAALTWGTLCAQPALSAPDPEAILTADLAAAPLDRAQWLIIAPQIGHLLQPLSDALQRLQAHPTIAEKLRPLLTALEVQAGFELFNPQVHARMGLDLEGAFWGLRRPGASLFALPFTSQTSAQDYARLALSEQPTAPSDEGRFQVGERAHFWYADGRVLWSDHASALTEHRDALRDAAGDPAQRIRQALSSCPQGPGQADLYARLRDQGAINACLTLRIDADRVRLEAVLQSPLLQGLLAVPDKASDESARLAEAAAAAAFRLGAKPIALLRATVPAAHQELLQALDGRFAATVGPDPEAFTVRLGLSPQAPPGTIQRLSQLLAPHARIVPEGARLLIYALDAAEGAAPFAILRQDARWLVLTGPRQPLAEDPPLTWPADRVPQAFFTQPPLLVSARAGGPPSLDGPLAEALRALALQLNMDPQLGADIASAVNFLGAHFGEVALRAEPHESGGVHLKLEAVLL